MPQIDRLLGGERPTGTTGEACPRPPLVKGMVPGGIRHICGVHRTYAGQIERGEKNLSFGNLLKISGALDMTVSELLARLEDGSPPRTRHKRKLSGDKSVDAKRRILEIQRLVKRLGSQRTELDRTIVALQEITGRRDAKR